jgi:hypothetical protein
VLEVQRRHLHKALIVTGLAAGIPPAAFLFRPECHSLRLVTFLRLRRDKLVNKLALGPKDKSDRLANHIGGKMKLFLMHSLALIGVLLILAACSQSAAVIPATPALSIQDAVGTGISLTSTAESVFNSAVATGISQTQAARPPSPTEVTQTQVPATQTAMPSQTLTPFPTPTPSPHLPAPINTRTAAAKTPHISVPITPLPPTPLPAEVVFDEYHTIQTLGSLNDSNSVDCQQFVKEYNHLSGLPASYAGIDEYARARAQVLETSRDENLFCAAALVGANTDNTIPFLQWGASRQGTDQAANLLRPVIIALGFTP